MGDTVDFVALMGPVACYLLGEPNQKLSSPNELRFGTHGSLSVDLIKGTWFDHEAGVGGGVLDLIRREKGFHGAVSCMDWIERESPRFTNGPAPPPQRTNGAGAPHASPQQKPRPQQKSVPLGREADYYDYLDEAGNFLYQVVRYDPKTFRQRRRDGNGGWIWDLDGVRRVPYRLTELTEALAQDNTVFIVEGEKDVNNMLANGLRATCNAMGAGSWTDSLNGFFGGADVVIIADNDPQAKNGKGELLYHQDGRPKRPGQDHAHAVAKALTENNTRRVRLLDLGKVWAQCPEKGDISDWFEAGFKTDDLWPIVERLPDWSPPAAEIAPLQTRDVSDWEGKEPPDRDWIVKNRIINRNVTMLAGDGAAGKTTVALQLCVCVASGMPDWLHGLVDRPGPVLFFSAEEDEDEVWRRLKDIVTHHGLSFAELKGKLHVICVPDDENTYLAVPKGRTDELVATGVYERLRVTIERIRPVLAVLESSADLFGGDEINRVQSRRFIALLRKLARPNNCAILLISHPSQSGMQSGSGTSGNTAWNNSVRSRMYFRPAKKDKDDDEDNNDTRELEFMKNNYGKKDEPVKVVWSNGVYVPLSMFKDTLKEEHRKQEAERAFMNCLRNQQALNLGEVSHLSKSKSRYAPRIFTGMKPQSQGFNERMLAGAMMRLIEAKKIVVCTGGSKTRPWEYLTFPQKEEGPSVPTG